MQRSFKPQNTGQYRGGPPFPFPLRSSLQVLFVRKPSRGSTGERLHVLAPRHDGSALAAPVAQLSERSSPKAVVVGEIPAGSTILRASGSEGIADPTDRESVSLGGASPLSPTISLPGRLISRTPPFEGGRAGANPAPAAIFHSPLAQNKRGSPTN
jgi:hypothetical protein